MARSELAIPPRDAVPRVDPADPIDWYYRPVTSALYRGRLRLATRMLGAGPYDHLVEIGYGSGVFLPELARRGRRVSAIDIHPNGPAVKEMLERLDVDVRLLDASLYELPFGDEECDGLVCLSVLEHLTDLDRALVSFRRVLRPGGVAVLGFPVRNVVTDTFFRIAGFRAREIHPSSHRDVIAATRRVGGFGHIRTERMPRWLPLDVSAYVCCRCVAV
jgi:ubiquinone/menaquinone biosynthesis C-methylase UbiE